MRRAALACFACLVAALLVGCASDKAGRNHGGAASGTAEGSQLSLPGGRVGRSFGPVSQRGVIVIADGPDTGAWAALAEEMGRAGYRVIVVPGTGSDDAAAARAAASQATRRGAERVVFVGSGRSAAAALEAARDGASGVAVLNPPGSLEIPSGGMPPVPLLAIASLTDGPGSAAAQHLYQAAGEPRTLALYPAREAAPAAFAGDSNELRSALLDFLRAAFLPLSA